MSSVTPSTLRSLALGCVEPRDLDILVGKSTECRQHRGSRCFAVFVEAYRQRYQLTKSKHKRGAITLEMYQILSEQNLRFLRFDETLLGWKEVSPKEARDKITHALKHAQKKHCRGKTRQIPPRAGSNSSHRSDTSHASSSLASLSSSSRSMSSRRSVSSNRSGGTTGGISTGTNTTNTPRLSRRRSWDWNHLLRQQQQQSFINSLAAVSQSQVSPPLEPPQAENETDSKPGPKPQNSMNSQTTRTTQCTSLTTTDTTEESSEPIPFDVSTTQYIDMFFPSVNREAMDDRLPKVPSRPFLPNDTSVNREAMDDRLPIIPSRRAANYDNDNDLNDDHHEADGDVNDIEHIEENDFCPLFDEMTLEQDLVLASERTSTNGLDPLMESCSGDEGSQTSCTNNTWNAMANNTTHKEETNHCEDADVLEPLAFHYEDDVLQATDDSAAGEALALDTFVDIMSQLSTAAGEIDHG